MRILLVEDDDLFCQLISKALTKQGFDTDCAGDGEEAMEKMKSNSYDLLITDIFMPNKEGIEVIQEVRNMKLAIKIIAISSGGQAGYSTFLKMAEAFGADATLRKPFGPDELVNVVMNLIDKTSSASA